MPRGVLILRSYMGSLGPWVKVWESLVKQSVRVAYLLSTVLQFRVALPNIYERTAATLFRPVVRIGANGRRLRHYMLLPLSRNVIRPSWLMMVSRLVS